MSSGRMVALGAAVGALLVGGAAVLVLSDSDTTAVGTIRVTVVTEGDVPADTTLRVTAVCKREGGEVERGEVTFDAGPVRTQVMRDFTLPARCQVAQSRVADATLVEYTRDGRPLSRPPSFELSAEAATTSISVTSSFPSSTAIGTLNLTKEVVGSPPGTARYVVLVTCEGGFEQEIEFPAAGGTDEVPITLGPGGTTCALEETERGGAIDVRYFPGQTGITIDLDRATLDVTITNRFG